MKRHAANCVTWRSGRELPSSQSTRLRPHHYAEALAKYDAILADTSQPPSRKYVVPIPRREARSSEPSTKEIPMRQNHFIAIAAAVAIGFTMKVFLLSGPSAEAGADVSKAPSGMDVSRMHVNAKLPMEEMHDMTFVF